MGAKHKRWKAECQKALDDSRQAAVKAQQLLRDRSLFGQGKRNQEAKRLQGVSDMAWTRYERLRDNEPAKDS